MKKLICLILCTILLGTSRVAFAQESGYIFKLDSSVTTFLLLESEGITPLGGGYYSAESLDAVYSFTGDEEILSIFPDYTMELLGDYGFDDHYISQQWYLDALGYSGVLDAGLTGEGVTIAVIDSGLDTDHPDIDYTRILEGYNCSESGAADDTEDNHGHGTGVIGVIAAVPNNGIGTAGIAPKAKIIPIKVTDTKTFKVSYFFQGLEKAIQSDCDVINMSVGVKTTDSEVIAAMEDYIQRAQNKGIVMVAAVGNDGTEEMQYPAGIANVIGVGAVDEALTASYFSQRNSSVDITAPGSNVATLSNDGGWVFASGTSFASPIAAAVAALIKEVRPELSSADVGEIFKEAAVDRGDVGYDTSYGYGTLDAAAVCTLPIIPGDIFPDGYVNVKDTVLLHQYLSGWNVTLTRWQMATADVYKDSIIDIKDAVALVQKL